MRFVCLFALVFAVPVCADDSAEIAALKLRVANLEVRLLAAEMWGAARGGYVPPVGPLKATTVPNGTTATQVGAVTYVVMPARVPLFAKLFGGCR